MSADEARSWLFESLQAGGCSEPAAVLEAIEALIDAKRAEELDRQIVADVQQRLTSTEKVPRSDALFTELTGRLGHIMTAQGEELDALATHSPRGLGELDAELRARLEADASDPRTLQRPINRDKSYAWGDVVLQPHGNGDAQAPGIDEGSDSEAVTVDLDWIASAVVDGIEADLDDRAGPWLGWLDDEVRGEIRAHWLRLVMVALRKVSP